jgi:transposase
LGQDNRLYFEGMMWIARTGSQWRHLPDEYGKWNSVFRRYRARLFDGFAGPYSFRFGGRRPRWARYLEET